MKLTKIITTTLAAGALATTATGVTASASSWHTSPIPARLRHTWHAKGNYNYKFKVYRYLFVQILR